SAIPLKKYYEMSRSEPDWHIRSATVVEAAVSTDPEIALRTPKTFASSTRYNRGYMPRVGRLTSIVPQGGSANRPTCCAVQWFNGNRVTRTRPVRRVRVERFSAL